MLDEPLQRRVDDVPKPMLDAPPIGARIDVAFRVKEQYAATQPAIVAHPAAASDAS